VTSPDSLHWSDALDDVDWHDLAELYRIAPLGQKRPDDLRTVFGNSRFVFFVREGHRLVGAGRALADGVDCAYLCDIAVHPDYQGIGLGKRIVQRLVEHSHGHRKIILYANVGKEGFYAKLGFRTMNTAMAIFADDAHALRVGLVSA
jgi:ribosomal protein S18 acetylase RimI-like enzyme